MGIRKRRIRPNHKTSRKLVQSLASRTRIAKRTGSDMQFSKESGARPSILRFRVASNPLEHQRARTCSGPFLYSEHALVITYEIHSLVRIDRPVDKNP